MKAHRIMAHMVAFYPSREQSLEVARALIDGGSFYLEVQFPFSEPTADGPYIQEACKQGLSAGFCISGGFDLIEEIRGISDIPVFIMSYANAVFVYGMRRYLDRCKTAGVQGVIVPDLPVDYDEGLFRISSKAGVEAVPLIAPSTSEQRLRMILSYSFDHVYATLRKGITGSFTNIGKNNLLFLKELIPYGKKVLAGFGISQRSQIVSIYPYIHAAVVGTALVREIRGCRREGVYEAVRHKIESLL
jgi:tryptophan synthase alpha chain